MKVKIVVVVPYSCPCKTRHVHFETGIGIGCLYATGTTRNLFSHLSSLEQKKCLYTELGKITDPTVMTGFERKEGTIGAPFPVHFTASQIKHNLEATWDQKVTDQTNEACFKLESARQLNQHRSPQGLSDPS